MTLGVGFLNFALSLAMIAALILAVFGARLAWSGADRRRGLLMIGVGVVLIANVLIWAWPGPVPQ